MKTLTTATILFFFLFFVFPKVNLFGQITLEKIYDHSLTITKINQTDYKYYLMDVGNSECRIYDLNHTLWKTISIPLPSNYYLYDVKFVTQNLFNSDTFIEVWYSAYEFLNNVETGNYISGIVNEKKVSGEPFLRLDISGWSPGTYAYRIIQGGEISVAKRFIIQ